MPESLLNVREEAMAHLVSYDVQRNHLELKEELRKRGFISCVSLNDGTRRRLPNTTVIHDSDDRQHVRNLFDEAVVATSQVSFLTKVLFVQYPGGFWLTSDEHC